MLHCGHVNAAIAARKLKRRYGTPYLLWTHALEIMDEWLRAKHSSGDAGCGPGHHQQRIHRTRSLRQPVYRSRGS